MGLYKDISNSEYAAKDTALYNRMNGVQKHSVIGLAATQIAPQLLTFTIGKLLNGSKKADDIETSNVNQSEDAKREQLNKDLDKILNEIGAKNERDINEAVSRKQDKSNEKIAKKENEINGLAENLATATNALNELKAKTFDSTNDPDGSLKAENDKQIKAKEKEIDNLNKKLETAKAELNETVETEKAELQKIENKANEAYKIIEELTELNKRDDKDTVVVAEKQEALKGFNEARKAFLTATTPEDKKTYAKKLQELYEANPNDATIKFAYEKMLQKKVDEALAA